MKNHVEHYIYECEECGAESDPFEDDDDAVYSLREEGWGITTDVNHIGVDVCDMCLSGALETHALVDGWALTSLQTEVAELRAERKSLKQVIDSLEQRLALPSEEP